MTEKYFLIAEFVNEEREQLKTPTREQWISELTDSGEENLTDF